MSIWKVKGDQCEYMEGEGGINVSIWQVRGINVSS